VANRGHLYVIAAPSGAGKTSLMRALLERRPGLSFSVSCTTRAPRPHEQNGRDYHFISRAEFERLVQADAFIEHADVFGNLYGTLRATVESALAEGRDLILEIDWQGANQVRRRLPEAIQIFILPPSIAELDRRLRTRAQDSDEVIAGRMAKSRDEISHWAEYDYVLVNDDLDRTFESLKTILTAERLKRERQPQLSAFVRTLNEEFEAR